MEYAVIMAGGTGKRLWPLSRETRPKQVLKLLDGQTLLRKCYERLKPIFDVRNIIVLTNAGYRDVVLENLAELPFDNVIAEPVVRDTAGAIGLAAAVLSKYDSNATMVVLTADQVIRPEEVLQQAIKDAIRWVNKNPDSLITFGIRPTFPSTQLGYIKLDKSTKCADCSNEIYKVESFTEKPELKVAEEYFKSGRYCWNSGMFVWKARTILREIYHSLPAARKPLEMIQSSWDGPAGEQQLREWFPAMPKISIDFAVMEKSQNVSAIMLDCQWLDMGSFAALADIISSDSNNNIVVAGRSEVLDCKDSILITEDENHLIAAIGLEKMVVVHSPDATLVCPIDEAERLKELIELIRQHGNERFL